MGVHQDIEFVKLKKKLKHVSNIDEKIELLEKLVKLEPRNPRNLTFRKQYKEELSTLKVKSSGKGKVIHSLYDAINYKRQLLILGRTNTGKSTLFNQLTGKDAKVASTGFITYQPEVGMMNCKDVPVQVVEIPPIYAGDSDTEKYQFIRNIDVICICAKSREDFLVARDQLEDHFMLISDSSQPDRLHKHRPKEEIVDKPAMVASWSQDIQIEFPTVDINDITKITDKIYFLLGIKRIYSVKNGEVDGKPVVFPKDSEVTITDFVKHLDKRLLKKYQKARITGDSSTFDGQIVGFNHLLQDGDKVELI